MHAVLQIKLTTIADNMGKKITIEGGIFIQQGFKIKVLLGSNQPVKANLLGCYLAPVTVGESVLGVGARIANCLKNHDSYFTGHTPAPSDFTLRSFTAKINLDVKSV